MKNNETMDKTFGDPPWFTYWVRRATSTSIPRLCIPDLVLSDAGSSVAGLQVATTVFPSGVAQAATWDPGLQRPGRQHYRRRRPSPRAST